METYYSIRVIKVRKGKKPEDELINERFDESDPVCDKILTIDELMKFAISRKFKQGGDNE